MSQPFSKIKLLFVFYHLQILHTTYCSAEHWTVCRILRGQVNLIPSRIRMEHIKMGKVKCCEYLPDAPDNSTPFLTVSAGALSRGLLTPPGVKVGLKDMERFPDMDATEGTTSFCTGGRVVSIWKHKTHQLESTANDNSLQSQQLHTQKMESTKTKLISAE